MIVRAVLAVLFVRTEAQKCLISKVKFNRHLHVHVRACLCSLHVHAVEMFSVKDLESFVTKASTALELKFGKPLLLHCNWTIIHIHFQLEMRLTYSTTVWPLHPCSPIKCSERRKPYLGTRIWRSSSITHQIPCAHTLASSTPANQIHRNLTMSSRFFWNIFLKVSGYTFFFFLIMQYSCVTMSLLLARWMHVQYYRELCIIREVSSYLQGLALTWMSTLGRLQWRQISSHLGSCNMCTLWTVLSMKCTRSVWFPMSKLIANLHSLEQLDMCA